MIRVRGGIDDTAFSAAMSVLFVVGTAFGSVLQVTALLDDWIVLRSDQWIIPRVGWPIDF